MAAKKAPSNALPLMVDNDQAASATITYASEVVAIIAEVEGIAGMSNVSSNILNKNRNVTRGVKVEMGTEEVAVDLYVIVEYGTPIQRAAMDAQESVRKAIESMTGLHVVRVDVHVQSVSFEQENKALQAGAASAALEAGVIDREDEPEEKPAEMPKGKPTPVKAAEVKKEKPVNLSEKKESTAEENFAEKKEPAPEAAPAEKKETTVKKVPAEKKETAAEEVPAEKKEAAVKEDPADKKETAEKASPAVREQKPAPRKKPAKAKKEAAEQDKPEEVSADQ